MAKTIPTNEESITDQKFLIEELRRNCRKLFGVSDSTFAGATSNINEKEFSIKGMKQIIDAWQGVSVKKEKEVK